MTSADQEWEFAGFTDLETGALGTPTLTLGQTLVPSFLALMGEETPDLTSLLWSIGTNDLTMTTTDRMLDVFIRIRTAADVLSFAKRYGVLGLCEHGLPASHNPPPPQARLDPVATDWLWLAMAGAPAPETGDQAPTTSYCRAFEMPDHPNFHFEPIGPWLCLAKQARLLLEVSGKIRTGAHVDSADLEVLGFPEPSEDKSRRAEAVSAFIDSRKTETAETQPAVPIADGMAPILVTLKLRQWAGWAFIRPSLIWRYGKSPDFAIEVNTWGSIVMQMMIAVSGKHGLEVCSGCGIAYTRTRKAQSGRRNYCSDCKEQKIPERDAAQDYRARVAKSKTEKGNHDGETR